MSGVLVAAALLACGLALPPQSDLPACKTAEECRALARAAIDARQYEHAHDLAWLAFQRGPRQDPQTLTLLARTQSLSGRGDDAFVMLRRLADAGVGIEDLETSADFERVRNDARWPELLAAFNRLTAAGADEPPVTESPRTAAPANAPTPTLAAAPAPSETARPPAPAETPPVEPGTANAARAEEDLAIAGLPFTPVALAYDAVSARFILSAATTDALTVLSQTSRTTASLTSRGWSGLEHTTAMAIDRTSGDLWVALNGAAGAALHRLQLISGRRLDALQIDDSASVEVASIVASRAGVYALDRRGRRVLRRDAQASRLVPFAALPDELTPVSMAQSPAALYVAHGGGIRRIEVASRRQRDVGAGSYQRLPQLHSLAFHEGALWGIEESVQERRVLRLQLNAAGTAVTRMHVLGTAASTVATLAAGVYYYFADTESGERVVRAIAAP
jgi:hypothetical protein